MLPRALVTDIHDTLLFYKAGLELFMEGQAFGLLGWLTARNCR